LLVLGSTTLAGGWFVWACATLGAKICSAGAMINPASKVPKAVAMAALERQRRGRLARWAVERDESAAL